MLVVVAKKCAGPAVFELWTLRNFIWVIELKLCWKIWSMFRKGHWVRWQRGRLMPDAQCSQCVVESMHVIVVLVTLSHHDPALWLALWSRQGLVSKPGDLELEQSDSPRFLFETTFLRWCAAMLIHRCGLAHLPTLPFKARIEPLCRCAVQPLARLVCIAWSPTFISVLGVL